MFILETVLFIMLVGCFIVGCKRTFRVLKKAINWLFDKLESVFDTKEE